MKKQVDPGTGIKHHEERDILDEITDDPTELVLDEGLHEEILSRNRKRNLKDVTIKMDPLQIMAIKKLSTMKSVPYQTLIRHWLPEGIKHELDSVIE